MSAERKHRDVIPTPAAVEQAIEDRTLDHALEDAAREIADSLRREERQQRQTRVVNTWISIFVVAVIAIVVGFSLPKTTRESPVASNPSQANDQTPRSVVPSSSTHTLRLPSGFEWQVELVDVHDGTFFLKSGKNLNCLGIYRLRGDRLEMYKPNDQRLTEFVWQKVGDNSYVLIEEPPAGKTGATYSGATLKPN